MRQELKMFCISESKIKRRERLDSFLLLLQLLFLWVNEMKEAKRTAFNNDTQYLNECITHTYSEHMMVKPFTITSQTERKIIIKKATIFIHDSITTTPGRNDIMREKEITELKKKQNTLI